jgi:uridine kinase
VSWEATAARVVAAVLAAPATLGAGRLVCVDGPSGAGKTTLAAALDRGFRDALRPVGGCTRVLHLDDVYDGWDGLAAAMAEVASSVVGPLRSGEAGRYRRFDWHAMARAEECTVPPCDVLVVEGVGAWSSAIRDVVTCLVWVETPSAVRLERGVARDGEALRPRLVAWRAQEEAMYAAERTREHADVVVDGQTGTLST